jgi:hypothetical protein
MNPFEFKSVAAIFQRLQRSQGVGARTANECLLNYVSSYLFIANNALSPIPLFFLRILHSALERPRHISKNPSEASRRTLDFRL